MSHRNASGDDEATNRRWQAGHLIVACQEAHAQGDGKALQSHLEDLYQLSRQDVEKQCAYWLWRFPTLNTTGEHTYQRAAAQLGMNIFADIIEDLLRVTIDPNRNAYGLVMTMAHHALYDLNQRTQGHRRARPTRLLQSGDPDALMAPPTVRAAHSLSYDDEGSLLDMPDPEVDFTARVLERERLRHCWPMVQRVLEATSAIDRYIFAQRVEQDPPTPFEIIAQQLGPGWTEGAVKQRHHRLMQRLKQIRDRYE